MKKTRSGLILYKSKVVLTNTSSLKRISLQMNLKDKERSTRRNINSTNNRKLKMRGIVQVMMQLWEVVVINHQLMEKVKPSRLISGLYSPALGNQMYKIIIVSMSNLRVFFQRNKSIQSNKKAEEKLFQETYNWPYLKPNYFKATKPNSTRMQHPK